MTGAAPGAGRAASGGGVRTAELTDDPSRRAILRQVRRAQWWLRTTFASLVFGLTALVATGYAYSRGLAGVGGIPVDAWFALAVVLMVLCVTALVELRRTIDRIKGMAPAPRAAAPPSGEPPLA